MSRFNIKAGYFSEQRSGPGLVIVERIDIYDSHRMENVSKLKQTEAKHRVSQHNSAVCPTCYQFTALASQPSFWTHKVLCYFLIKINLYGKAVLTVLCAVLVVCEQAEI